MSRTRAAALASYSRGCSKQDGALECRAFTECHEIIEETSALCASTEDVLPALFLICFWWDHVLERM